MPYYAAKDGYIDYISKRDLLDEGDTYLETVPNTGYSDYGGSLVEKSNRQALVRDFGKETWLYHKHTAYSGEMLFYAPDEASNEFKEICRSLERDYPLYDEEHYYMLEQDVIEEAWVESYGAREDLMEELDVTEDEADQLRWLCNEHGIYAEVEYAVNVHFNMKDMLKYIQDNELVSHIRAEAKIHPDQMSLQDVRA